MKTNVLLALFNSYITAAITASATSLVLNSVSNIPTVPFYALLDCGSDDEEVVRVTAVATATKTLTVVRAQGGTTAVAHGDETLLHACEINGVNIELDSLTRVLTGSTGLNAMKLTVTDETTLASGNSQGLHIAFTSTGIKTGSGGIRGLTCDVQIAADCANDVRAISIYVGQANDPTVGNDIDGLYMYLDGKGSATYSACYNGVDINIDSTAKATGGNFAIRIYGHGGAMDAILHILGNGATYLIDLAADTTVPCAPNTHSIDSHALCGILAVAVAGNQWGYIPVLADVPA